MIAAVITVVILLLYGTGMGFTYELIVVRLRKEKAFEPEMPAGIGALLWPLVLPAQLGRWVAQKPTRDAAKVKRQAEYIKKLEQEVGILSP